MSAFKTPGVYVKEISTLPASVAQVETAIPAFIGCTQKAERKGISLKNKPTRITSYPEYLQLFGGAEPETTIKVTITETAGPGDGDPSAFNVKANEPSTKSKYLMSYSMRMYFSNGGGPCYIVSVGDYAAAISKAVLNPGLSALEQEDEPTLIVFPDLTNIDTPANHYEMYSNALVQCAKLQDRFTIIDTYKGDSDGANILRSTATLGTANLKYGAAYYPFLKTTLNYSFSDKDVLVEHHTIDKEGSLTENGGDYDAVSIEVLKNGREADGAIAELEANDELYNLAKGEVNLLTVTLPPSPLMAGVYARVDSERGVWKAPANVSLSGVTEPSVKINHEMQQGLNVDTTAGKSINAIRSFTGKGILVWGARTLAGNDNEWRYVNVRRFFNMVEESVKKATERMVFEPNDANTWVKIKAMIENYLTLLWRDGALAGAVPEHAFFVNVGLGSTMTPQDILEGRLNVEIGMAAVRPAEFIILKFSHKMQES